MKFYLRACFNFNRR